MRDHDLCLAWNWEHDADFVRILDSTCAARGLTLLNASPENLDNVLTRLAGREAGFRVLLDRASEANPAYLPLVDIAKSLGARRLNPRELADRGYDKALVHHLFLDDGIPTPRTIILPAYHDQPELTPLDLQCLGKYFTVKPALGGGGEGVLTNVSTLGQIQAARLQFPEQQYLLQEHVTPKVLNGLPAWFRVIYCLEEIFITFWDTTTHVYTIINETGGHTGPPQQFNPPQPAVGAVLRDNPLLRDSPVLRDSPIIESLREVTRRIARICRLDIFSTEICLTGEDRLLVVDYVNDPIDLRLQSRAVDGVPDKIVERIAARIVELL